MTRIEVSTLQGKFQRKEVKSKMAEINLSKYGITGTTEIVYNPSYELLFEEETKEDEIQTTIDTINKKFGKAIISSASLKKIEKNN